MGTTRTPITVMIDVPDDRDQDHEIERYELCRQLTEHIKAIVDEPQYDDILATMDGGVQS